MLSGFLQENSGALTVIALSPAGSVMARILAETFLMNKIVVSTYRPSLIENLLFSEIYTYLRCTYSAFLIYPNYSDYSKILLMS